jgi:hypothetical protein
LTWSGLGEQTPLLHNFPEFKKTADCEWPELQVAWAVKQGEMDPSLAETRL